MKALILTFAPVTEKQKELIKNTNITKIAINGHSEELNPDYRICSDYGVIEFLMKYFKQKIITVREWVKDERLINATNILFKGSTLVAAIDYLVFKKYDEILIVGDNTVREKFFQKRINDEIEKIKKENPQIKIFQYRKGNYNLSVLSVERFISGLY